MKRRTFAIATGLLALQAAVVLASGQYTLIPLYDGDPYAIIAFGRSVDASGNRIMIGAPIATDDVVRLFDRAAGSWSSVTAPLVSTGGLKLSADGRRFFYKGLFRLPDRTFSTGIGFTDLATDTPTLVAPDAIELFNVDRAGSRIVFQKQVEAGSVFTAVKQYFLFDESSGETRQLTDDPTALVYSESPDACPRISATVPQLSADGDRVVIITHSTLGMVAEDPSVGCRIFTYTVSSATWRQVVAFPQAVSIGTPALSDDGRWLSYVSSRPTAEASLQSFPALLDLDRGEVTDPLAGLVAFPSFDAVISGDGTTVVLSSEDDLDPQVGNPDHNMELFAYDRATGGFAQITETTGGIGPTSSGCEPYVPVVSGDASLVLFGFFGTDTGTCLLAGPQRNAADGFTLGSIRAVRKRVGNRGPALHPSAGTRLLTTGERLEMMFSATDPDGDYLTFFAQQRGRLDLPPSASFSDHHDGTATFDWQTQSKDAGVYTLRVAVFDEGGGEQFADFGIAVCDAIIEEGNLVDVLAGLFGRALLQPCHDADLNHDGVVSAADLLVLAAS